MFAALIIGAVIGSCLTWIAQGKHRKALRDTAYENTCLKRDYEKEHPEATEIAPGLPLISSN